MWRRLSHRAAACHIQSGHAHSPQLIRLSHGFTSTAERVNYPHTHIVDLRSGSFLCCSLGSPSHEKVTLLRVREVLNAANFKFPVFLDKRYDGDSIIWEHGPGSGVEQYRALCRSYKLRSGMKRLSWMRGRTWKTTFPGASIISWTVISDLVIPENNLWAHSVCLALSNLVASVIPLNASY